MECLKCEYKEECQEHYGKIGIDEEDCTAIEGSHFCKASWKQFFNDYEDK